MAEPTTTSLNTEEKTSPKSEEQERSNSTLGLSSEELYSYDCTDSIVEQKSSDKKTYTFQREEEGFYRKVYFAIKVQRFSDIDNVRETFRCRFHLYLNWMITAKEYEVYLTHKKESIAKKIRFKWEPKFKPRIEFVNSVEEHSFEVIDYPPFGQYRILTFQDWAMSSVCGFDASKTLFCRMKMECDYTFSEQLELRTFPFDCQDFAMNIRESSGTKKVRLLPEPRYTTPSRKHKSFFFKIDPTYSVIDEWDFHSAMCEIANSSSSDSRSKTSYHELMVRFKLRRRWKVYVYNIVFYYIIITLLSLSCFTLDDELLGERLNLGITILLTQVAFQYVVFEKLPHIPYLTFLHKYIIISFLFVCAVVIQSSLVELIHNTIDGHHHAGYGKHVLYNFDLISGWGFTLFWIAYHTFFLLRGAWHHHWQGRKMLMDSDQIAEFAEDDTPQFLMSWTSMHDLQGSLTFDDWQRTETTRADNTQKKIKQEMKKKKKHRGAKKTHCVMEFGGNNGEILSFISYTQKNLQFEDSSFCGIHCLSCWYAVKRCFVVCDCCCGQNNDGIQANKSLAYDNAQELQIKM